MYVKIKSKSHFLGVELFMINKYCGNLWLNFVIMSPVLVGSTLALRLNCAVAQITPGFLVALAEV